MISIEQWRARIGTFNCKRGYSGFLSSLFSSSSYYYYYQPSKRENLSRGLSSTAVNSLQAEGHSPSAPCDGYTVSSISTTCTAFTTNCKASTSAPCITTVTTSSFSSPSSYFFYSSSVGLFSLRHSLLRDILIILLVSFLSQQLIISGDIETNPGPKHGAERPSYNQLLKLKKADGSTLQIVKTLSSFKLHQCEDFAYLLLRDDVQVRKLKSDYEENKDQFVRAVLKDWLSRDDSDSSDSAVPRTWEALAQCVTDAELDGTLVKAIREACTPTSADYNDDEHNSSVPPAKKLKTSSQSTADTDHDAKNADQPAVSLAVSQPAVVPLLELSEDPDSMTSPWSPLYYDTMHHTSLYQISRRLMHQPSIQSALQQQQQQQQQERQQQQQTKKPFRLDTAPSVRVQGSTVMKQWKQTTQCKMMRHFRQQHRKLEKMQQQNAAYSPMSASSSPLEPLEKFKVYLKGVYLQPRVPLSYFKEPNCSAQHWPFNLKLITRNSDCRIISLSGTEEVILLRLHNNVDWIRGQKSELKMADIGKCTDRYDTTGLVQLADNILVEGPSGVGKSTFAHEISQKWAKGELLQEWSLVIILPLQDQRVRNAKILEDLIYYPDSNMRQMVCQDLVSSKGEKTLFILDGYDQLSDEQRKDGLVFQQLVDKDQELLPYATLMILSRATHSVEHHTPNLPRFYSEIHQHIEISLPMKENICSYITLACSDDSLATALNSYLSSHPFINSLMYIPLQCAMVTDLYRIHWKCGDKEFAPITLTNLYTDLVRTLLLRYLSTHPVHSQKDWRMDKFTDLPDEVYEQFKALAQLAARGIEDRMYVFDSGVPKELLGLMHQVEEVYPGRGRSSVSYSFLHLTLQEYLAAYHCSLHDTGKLQAVLHTCNRFAFPNVSSNPFQVFCSQYDMGSGGYYHWPVLLFTVGLANPNALLEILPIQERSLVSTLHLLYETQSPELVHQILSSYWPWCSPKGKGERLKPLNISPKSPLDFFVTGYCIPHSNSLWNVKTDCKCSDRNFDHLSQGLKMSSDQGNNGQIEKLAVHASKVAMLHLLHPHTKRLVKLTINAGYMDGTEKGAEPEVYNQFPSWYPLLKVLKVNINVPSLVLPLFDVVPKMCSGPLKRLQLDLSSLSTENTIFKQLKKCPVEQLKIKGRSHGHTFPSFTISHKVESLELTELALTPALAECVSIEHNALHTLVLRPCQISDDAGTTLVRSLQSPHCRLETIELGSKDNSQYNSNIPDSVVKAIASCHTLKRCSMIKFKGSIVEHFVAGLEKNESLVLEELTIDCNSNCTSLQIKHFKELIHVADEQGRVKKMHLSSCFKGRHDVRDDLVIDYI